jgi:hypothetical protein
MSKLETNTIDTVSGTSTLQVGSTNTSTITLGVSGDTINVPSGVTIANSGTATGFGANTPAFDTHLNSNSSNISMGVQTKIGYDTETYDVGGCYNNTGSTVTLNGLSAPAHSFVPNVSGKYFFYATARIDSSSNFPHDAYFYFFKNGSNFRQFQRLDQSSDFSGNIQMSTAIELNGTGDYVQVYIELYNGVSVFIAGATNGSKTSFGGYKLIGV